MSEATLFEKICRKELPASIVHEDEMCVAFHDIAPQAPLHLLIVPRQPIVRLAEARDEDQLLLGHLLGVAAKVAKQLDVADSGFRIVINNGRDGGEAVPHLHVHLLAGRQMKWPPG